MKYALCSTDTGYLTKGMGGLNFNFTNLRSDISFHYFTATKAPGGKFYPGTFAPVLVATSPNNVTFSRLNEPLKPRVVPVGRQLLKKLHPTLMGLKEQFMRVQGFIKWYHFKL